MRLADVMDEVAGVLDTIPGLRVFAYPPSTVIPPAAIVSYPDSVDYDETYGRGKDHVRDLPVILLAGKATVRAARDKVSGWADGSGAGSVKALLEGHVWSSCEVLTVADCKFEALTIAGVDYIAAIFSLDIIGKGA